MLFFYQLKGSSMLPTLAAGDFVVASRLYRQIKTDDLLIVNHPRFGRIIKRAQIVADNKSIYLSGDNSHSITSEQMGWVSPRHVQGKVLFSIKQKAVAN